MAYSYHESSVLDTTVPSQLRRRFLSVSGAAMQVSSTYITSMPTPAIFLSRPSSNANQEPLSAVPSSSNANQEPLSAVPSDTFSIWM